MIEQSPVSPPIRLLVVDVDGTLVGADRRVSPRVECALAEARRRGVQVALCTGRSMFGARQYTEALGLPGFHIFDAGATIADPATGNVLVHLGIERPVARNLVRYAQQANIHLEVYVGERYYVECETEHSRIHFAVMRVPPIIAPLAEVVEHEYVTKMESLTLNDDETARVNAMGEQYAEDIEIGWATAPGTSAGFANIIRRGITKGVGVQKLAEHLSIPLSQVMGVGDGYNDAPLIQAAGVGVAMGDAPDAVKQIAQWVTGTVAEDGLAMAVERFILSNGHH